MQLSLCFNLAFPCISVVEEGAMISSDIFDLYGFYSASSYTSLLCLDKLFRNDSGIHEIIPNQNAVDNIENKLASSVAPLQQYLGHKGIASMCTANCKACIKAPKALQSVVASSVNERESRI